MKRILASVLCVLLLLSSLPLVFADAAGSATIDFTDKANRVSYSAEQQVWAQNGIVVTNDKAASTTAVGDYGGEGYPVRFYKGSSVTVEYIGMTQIVFNCDDYKASYPTDLAASITDGSVSVDGTVVTVSFANAVDAFVIAELAAQVRVDSIIVYGEGGVTPPVEPDVPPVEPDVPDQPVEPTGSATIDFTDKANRVSYSSEKQVWAQNGIVVTNDKAASTTAVGDYGGEGYPVRFYKGSSVTVEYMGMTQIVFNCDDYKASYPTDLETSIKGATVSVEGTVVTVTLPAPANSFVIAELAAQVRVDSITVYGEGGAPVVPPVDPPVDPEPDVPVEPGDEPDMPGVPGETAVLDFSTLDNRVSCSTSQQVWKQNGITFTNEKGASTSNVNEKYFNPVRCYKSSTVTIQYPGMRKIVIDSVTYDDNDYAIGWTDSFSADATATVVDGNVTIVLAEPADVFVWEKLTAQSRAYTITVYTSDDGTTPEVPPIEPDPPVIPDGTELTIADAIALGQTFAHNTFSAEKYYIAGVITEVYNTQYGNMRLTDEDGNILTIYGTYNEDGTIRYDGMTQKPMAGDTVVLYGVIGQYNGTSQMKNGWIIGFEGGDTPVDPPVDPPVNPPVSDELETDYPFLFGMTQYNVSEEDVYFLAGGMDGYYMATTTNPDEAIVVYAEATNGGYYFYTYDGNQKLYINMVVSADGAHVNGAYEAKASTVYRYDAYYGTLIADVDGSDYWFGTRNDKNYTTVGPCKVEYEGFYCEFYYFTEEEECEHEYDDEYDAECNLCGELREVPEKPVETDSDFVVGNVQGSAGDTVQVTVSAINNPGIISTKVKVYFDTTALKLVGYTAGNFSAGGYSWSDKDVTNENGYFIINWCDSINPDSTADLLATLSFEILEGTADGTYPITIEFSCDDDVFNAENETVWFNAVDGSVTVVTATYIPGDIDGNGRVNNRDLGYLQQFLNEWDITIDEDAADLDGNGRINNRDLGELQKMLNE